MRRLGTCLASTNREALGFRPALTEGVCHCELAGRGQASGAKSPRVAKSPEERTRVLKRRGGASDGRIFYYQGAPCRRSASPSSSRARFPENSQSRRWNLRAAMTLGPKTKELH